MKAVLISCFNYYDNRLRHVEKVLKSKGYDVTYITSDFDHINKVKYTINRNETIQIHVNPYFKNLSVQRLLSHYFFARGVFKEVNKIKPDLLYVMIPPNFLARFASQYCKKNNVKLIYDIYDLWPETFPYNSNLFKLPFIFWRKLRDNNLGTADAIITECKLYQEILEDVLSAKNTSVLYLTKEQSKLQSEANIDTTVVNFCYLGSINNIIDITSIAQLLEAVNNKKNVTLHIIGDGEKRDQFIDIVRSRNINVEYHGKIYEEEKKREIFNNCSFGINMMLETVCVGLTMKSIDYFEAGIPIINNIKADTYKIVEEYGIGYNISDANLEDIASKIANADKEELLSMRENTIKVFDQLFSIKAFNQKLEKVLMEI